ncbi:hypothetical protein FSP39_019000 [Pinctada imbricata]|uniref:Methyltransferase domain-containing protein n=1 Tax=Pinctada imbricata TaxID=66713 RepID=A0AA89C401_PINIB|nr:hypothetical protein FSP39_019000 [Pinctada imbricata]
MRLGKTLHLLGTATKCPFIVDVGAGQGHLSRLLTFEHGFKVTTVEAAGCHAPKAKKFDRDAHNLIRKKKLKSSLQEKKECGDPRSTDNLPEHVTCFIESDTSKSEFLEIVQQSFSKCDHDKSHSVHLSENTQSTSRTSKLNTQKVQCDSGNYKAQNTDKQTDSRNTSNPTKIQMDGSSYVQGKEFILTGLHACGDLTTTMLRVFSSCPEIVGIASVACCYMKLTDKSTLSGKDFGYPMSQYLLRSHPDHSLSYEAREMACHFVDSYTERLRENKQSSLKLHCYRAMLQCIIHHIDPSFHHGSVKISVKNGENLDFIQYAKQGLQRLGIKTQVPESLLDEVHSKQSMWKDVVAFYTLRLSLAPVVETLILLDRMLYLWENGLSSTLVPIFDPKISPRNFALLACKKTSS